MKTLFTLILSSFFFSTIATAAICTSLSNGAWENPATWSCGAVPSAGDTIIIAVSHTVTLSTNTNMMGAATTIVVNGTFEFDSPSAKLFLGCGSSVIINAGGLLISTGIGVPSHSIKICDVEVFGGSTKGVSGPVVLTGPTPLSVELVYFKALEERNVFEIEWKTASEINNSHFVVEGSVDENVWDELAIIDGVGNSVVENVYNVNIDNSLSKNVYLRLTQVDLDGTSKMFDVISADKSDEIKFNVYPNPLTGGSLKINVDSKSNYSINIVSVQGAVVYENNDLNETEVWISDLSLNAGMYIVLVNDGSNVQSKRLVVR